MHKAAISFFKFFSDNNGFKFDQNEENYEETLDELSDFMNWNERTYKRNLKTLKSLIEEYESAEGSIDENQDDNEEEKYQESHNSEIEEFFKKYIEHNNFKYDENYTYEQNFDRLADKMKWNNFIYNKKKQEFDDLHQNNDEEKSNSYYSSNEITEEDYDIDEFKTIKEYFNYFVKYYNFDYKDRPNAREDFNDLSKFMGWRNCYHNYQNKFYNFNNLEDKYKYLVEISEGIHIPKFKSKFFYEDLFEEIADQLNWNEKQEKLKEFNQVIKNQVETEFGDLSLIIKRYNLQEHNNGIVPKKKSDCESLIRKYLFVNIYDYVKENNNICFKNLKELREYTIENRNIFPLHEAKENFCYKVLLRHILR